MKLLIVSPHLDDAVLSLGAFMSAARRIGIEICVVTTFAGDLQQASLRPSNWDIKRGVETAADAYRERRKEDANALARLDVSFQHLPFWDDSYMFMPGVPERSREALWEQLGPLVGGADYTLIPGWPIRHPDHLYVARLLSSRTSSSVLACFVEYPYATGMTHLVKSRLQNRQPEQLLGPASAREIVWSACRTSVDDRERKRWATRAYEQELNQFSASKWRQHVREKVFGIECLGTFDNATLPDELRSIVDHGNAPFIRRPD